MRNDPANAEENAKARKGESAKSDDVDEEPRKPGRFGSVRSWLPGYLIDCPLPVPFRVFAFSRFRVLLPEPARGTIRVLFRPFRTGAFPGDARLLFTQLRQFGGEPPQRFR